MFSCDFPFSKKYAKSEKISELITNDEELKALSEKEAAKRHLTLAMEGDANTVAKQKEAELTQQSQQEVMRA